MDNSRFASRLRQPAKIPTSAIKQPLGEVTSNNISTLPKTTQVRPAKNASAVPSLTARKTRRSKSFGVSTAKVALHVTQKLRTAVNSNVVKKPLISSRPATATTSGYKRPTVSQPPKTTLKRAAPPTTTTNAAVTAPKLAKYDYKGRLEALAGKHKALVQENKETTTKLESLEKEHANSIAKFNEQEELIEELKDYKVSTEELVIKLRQAEDNLAKSQKLELKLQNNLDKAIEQHENLRSEFKSLNTTYKEVTNELEIVEENHAELQTKHEALQENFDKLQKEHDELKTDFASLQDKYQGVEKENAVLKADLEVAQQTVEALKSDLRDHETLRRRLHNDIQDLKGNIRVFCRVRPIKSDEEDRMPCNMNFMDEVTLELKKAKESLMSHDKGETKLEFTFDRVFGGESSQAEVFEDLSQLVQSTLDGYNVCVFAYGQTGSGKTFTMLGNHTNLGMIPRSVELLFNRISELEKLGWVYEVQVSFLEIYNETIKDLLNPDSKKPHDIMHNEGKGTVITNLHTVSVSSASAVKQLMNKANNNRAIAATNFNLHSSRSHAVTKLSVRGYFEQSEYIGSLNLVDLAGSESAKNSERMTETKNINRSLSALGTVMLALHNKDKHVPYRNSKLTYLLQSSLGGNSKTLMFVNISPLEDCYSETVNSLRFASKVKEVKTGIRRNRALNVR